ncbi:ABC transporter permease [Brachybacterium sp. YJGR34]|uniref:ABC transporter permease n=1 Tax=Brachybacterium sp. YJGR34 TaxID=2059911 RepID=UPI000E0B373E|nr:ABC transporter permease [Brachybacterium sp. YJGR34]
MADRPRTPGAWALFAAVALILLFLVGPLVVVVVSSFSATSSLAFPPEGYSLRWYEQVLTSREWRVSFSLSFLLAALAVPTVAVLSLLGGYGLVRGAFRGHGAIQAFLLSPLMVPEIMLGIGLLTYLQSWGLINTITGLWLAHSLVALPFGLRAVINVATSLDPRVEASAASLGAGPVRVFLTVTVPQLLPGLVSAGVFAAVISLGEVAVSTFIAGANTTTVPLRVLSAAQFELDPTAAVVSTLLMMISAVVILVLERLLRVSDHL